MVQISLMTQGKSWQIFNDILLYQQSQQLVIIHFFQKIPLQNQDARNEILSLHNRFIKQKTAQLWLIKYQYKLFKS